MDVGIKACCYQSCSCDGQENMPEIHCNNIYGKEILFWNVSFHSSIVMLVWGCVLHVLATRHLIFRNRSTARCILVVLIGGFGGFHCH